MHTDAHKLNASYSGKENKKTANEMETLCQGSTFSLKSAEQNAFQYTNMQEDGEKIRVK